MRPHDGSSTMSSLTATYFPSLLLRPEFSVPPLLPNQVMPSGGGWCWGGCRGDPHPPPTPITPYSIKTPVPTHPLKQSPTTSNTKNQPSKQNHPTILKIPNTPPKPNPPPNIPPKTPPPFPKHTSLCFLFSLPLSSLYRRCVLPVHGRSGRPLPQLLPNVFFFSVFRIRYSGTTDSSRVGTLFTFGPILFPPQTLSGFFPSYPASIRLAPPHWLLSVDFSERQPLLESPPMPRILPRFTVILGPREFLFRVPTKEESVSLLVDTPPLE